MATSVMLVRHPETEANRRGVYQGRGDAPLTDLGRSQAVALNLLAEGFGPQVILSSPAPRCVHVAKLMASCGTALHILDDLAEIDFGRAEGLTFAEAAAVGIRIDLGLLGSPGSDDGSPGASDSTTRPVAPGGETLGAFCARVERVAAHIEQAGRRVVVVTHAGVIRGLLRIWLSAPWDVTWRFAIPPATVAILEVSDGSGALTALHEALG